MGDKSNGRVVWHDCMTTDIDKSVDFYTKMFGWEIKDVEMKMDGPGPYKMIYVGEDGIGGFIALDKDAPVPPHWIAYVACDDVGAACKRAEAGGGKVGVPPTDIPNVGKFAVIVDPQGASIAPYQSASGDLGPEPEGHSPVGHFIWEEMLAKDPAAAAAFYGELFGWQTSEMDMGEMGAYRIQMRGETPEAGIMAMPPDADGPPAWLSYVHVEDVDASTAKLKELGGKTFVEPMSIPNVGRMSVNCDPTGVMIALYRPESMC